MPMHPGRLVAGLVLALAGAGGVVAGEWPAAAAPPLALDAPVGRDPRLAELARPLVADGSVGLQRRRLAGEKAPSSLNAIVLLCDFPDSAFYGRPGREPGDPATSTQSDFYYLAHDSLYYHHFLRDVADYFAAVSGGRFTLHHDVHGTVLHLPQPMGWYGDHPEEGEQPILLAADAVAAADAAVDFSAYDTVVLVHAGAGEETDLLGDSPEQIYSTYLSPEDFAAASDDTLAYLPTGDHPEGEGVGHVLVLPENHFQDARQQGGLGRVGSLGVYCFEVGLRLGMLSLSDATPPGRPDSQGVGEFDLMGWGLYVGAGYIPPHPSAFNKLLVGWLEPVEVDPTAAATWVLDPAERTGGERAAARVDVNGREYWLLEYRLQDPDGTGIFNFGGDLNGDNVPNFYDADSAFGDGRPTGWFDPEHDTRERLTDAEWDFAMSENAARAQDGIKGAGSGIYVWHVDEGVIADAFASGSRQFNADPRRKAVDLEEADGIQDLDTALPSQWWLGGDDDSFRGEDAAEFGPQTRPATDTAGGAPTGIVFDEISGVVVDSTHVFHAGTDSAYVGIRYADTMTFRCRRLAPAGAPLESVASYTLPGIDLAGAHLLAADLDGDDPELEVLAAGRDGALVVWDGELPAPVVTYLADAGDTVRFAGPAAAGRLAGAAEDGGPDVVLASSRGVHRLRWQGGALVPQGGDPLGLLPAAIDVVTPPVLWPVDGLPDGGYDPTLPVQAWVVAREPAGDSLGWLAVDAVQRRTPLGPGRVTAPATAAAGRLWVTLADTVARVGRLYVHPLPGTAGDPVTLELDGMPGPWPVVVGTWDDRLAVAVVDSAGLGTTLWLDATDLAEVAARSPWPRDAVVRSPLGPDLAFVGDEVAARVGANGRAATGWPRRPSPRLLPVDDPARGAMPLSLDEGILFAAEDGQLYLYARDGILRAGWPLAGPADVAGTPVAADLDGDGRDELVAAGAFGRITGLGAAGDSLLTVARSQLVVFTGLRASGRPRMWGGTPWRSDGSAAVPADGDGGAGVLVGGSVVCYPNPATGDLLHVRGTARADGRARAGLLNLEGERVTTSAWVDVIGGVPFELDLALARAAAGLYVCRLEVATGEGTETSVRSIAVAR